MAETLTGGTIIPLIAGFLPALFWLWFWLQEDREHPEPKTAIAGVFIAGAISTALALPLQHYAPILVNGNASNPDLILFFLWAGAEEVAKYIAAAYVALSSRNFDEPQDAMIYMITASLGFAAVENSLFLIKAVQHGGEAAVFFNRFLGATLVHVVSSAVVGGALALAFYKHPLVRISYTTIGLLTGALLHALFNFFIIRGTSGENDTVLFSLWFAVVIIFLLFEKVKHLKKI